MIATISITIPRMITILYNAKGKKVRSYSSKDKIAGNVNKMAILDRTLLLDGGDYAFTPYYVMYGDTVSLATRTVTLDDPGVVIEITGTTSYSKYLSGDVDGANGYPNNQIGDLKVSTNLAGESIEYAASLTGANKENVNISNVNYEIENERTVAKHSGVTCTGFQNYTMAVTIKFGDKTYNVSKAFHITGLPYEAKFDTNPQNWTPAWTFCGYTGYTSGRVQFKNDGDCGLRSPKFHITDNVVVKTAFYSCGANVDYSLLGYVIDQEAYRDVYYAASEAGSTTLYFNTGQCVRGDYKVDPSDGDYLEWSNNMTLTSEEPAIMYAVHSNIYNKSMYKVKIHYSIVK